MEAGQEKSTRSGAGSGGAATRSVSIYLDGLSDHYTSTTGNRQKGEKAEGRTLVPAPD